MLWEYVRIFILKYYFCIEYHNMSLLRKPQKPILQVCNSLKIDRHF